MFYPVYAAIIAAFVFYLLIPIIGGFVLRGQWRRFRERVTLLGLAPRLRYRDISAAIGEGRSVVGRYRLHGTIEAIEGTDRVWVRGEGVSAIVDLSRAPLYVLGPASADLATEAGSIVKMKWNSVSSLVEGTSIFVAGLIALEGGNPVYMDSPEESLIAVCHEGGEERLISRLISGGRAQNEYWNNPTRLSMAMGLVSISAILLLYRASPFSSYRALVFLAGASPVLPFAPPGLVFFLLYLRLWRRALESRTARDLSRLPLHYSQELEGRAPLYSRQELRKGQRAPQGATGIGLATDSAPSGHVTIFEPLDPEDPAAEVFAVAGDPETLARKAERDAFIYAAVAGVSFALAIAVNFVLAFLLWRLAL